MQTDVLRKNLLEALTVASTSIPVDVEEALRSAREKEDVPVAMAQLDAMLENIDIARSEGRPLCQDTGTVAFFVTAGYDFPFLSEAMSLLGDVLREATSSIPLRPNTVNPFTGVNPGDNSGPYMPIVDVMFVEGDSLKIDILPKGGGSENLCALWMLTPAGGVMEFRRRLVEHIQRNGGRGCPPIVLGIGFGSTSDFSMRLAKRSLLRPIGSKHPEKHIAELEEAILQDVNALGIGAMGLGGSTTALDVHIEYTNRHPASFPVALAVQCWVDRRATVVVDGNGNIDTRG